MRNIFTPILIVVTVIGMAQMRNIFAQILIAVVVISIAFIWDLYRHWLRTDIKKGDKFRLDSVDGKGLEIEIIEIIPKDEGVLDDSLKVKYLSKNVEGRLFRFQVSNHATRITRRSLKCFFRSFWKKR